ncbi:class I SAM-dependent methyltransferase [Thermobifida alba]|jgi:SAM-dependent methyltransferase|uniref:Class I SAM-dependent methyltransferase n=1 Tax=Thermobifida alba TaxID=53522 RepID=A0ABY4KZD8_THEAE|nr:class I SAM-dependent methyltransferase [Thermobifida alba]UPT20805.1 class I SAM-dependent methyltransferase [Thermobifida alba]
MYTADLAEVYHLIYTGRGKDYATEARTVEKLVRAHSPEADSLLDVACGTGAHLAAFQSRFSRVEGLEFSPDMIAEARSRRPGITISRGDMRDFDLGRRFDTVICMASSIAYLRSTGELGQTVAAMARHLRPGGVIVLEPWVFPENFIPGYVAADIARDGDRTVARVSHSHRRGRKVPMVVHYIVADAQTGIRHFTDTHTLRLFEQSEYESAFDRAGCDVHYERDARFPLGLFIGHARVPNER